MNISSLIDINVQWYPKWVVVSNKRSTQTLNQIVLDKIVEEKYNGRSKEDTLIAAINKLNGG